MNASTIVYEDETFSTTEESLLDDVTNHETNKVHVRLYQVIGSIGMLDNCFVILVILLSKNMRQKVCNLFILNQSLADFLGSLFLVINSPLVANNRTPPSGLEGHFYCRLWANSYPMWMVFVMSTVNLVLITVDRFIEIVHPFTYKVKCNRNRAIGLVAVMWIIITALLFGLYGAASTWSGLTNSCVLNQNFPNRGIQILTGVLIFCIIQVLPLVVMAFCYISIIKAMRQVTPGLEVISVAEQNRKKRQERIRRNLIITLLTVAVAYFLCVTWNQMYFLLLNFGIPLSFDSPFYHFSVYALFMNCIINPFIYTWKYREFQIAVKTLFAKGCPSFCLSGGQRDGKIGGSVAPSDMPTVTAKVSSGQNGRD